MGPTHNAIIATQPNRTIFRRGRIYRTMRLSEPMAVFSPSTSAPGTPRHGLSLGVKPRRRHETFSDGLPATKRERARIRTEGAGVRRGYGPLGSGWSHTLALSSKQFLLQREPGRDLPWLRRQRLRYLGEFTATRGLVSAPHNATSLPPQKIAQSDAAARKQPL